MWITSKQLEELGVAPATIYRKTKSGEWASRIGKSDGREGRPYREYLLSSLPADIQIKFAKLGENRASAVEREPKDSNPDERLNRLQVALARFSPPQYTLEDRLAVERHCVAMAALYDEAARLIKRLKRERKMTVPSPGAMEAGRDRAYHPDLHSLASRAVSSDSTYLKHYPSAGIPPSVMTLIRALSEYQKSGPVIFIRQAQTLSPAKDDRFLEIPDIATEWLRANLKNYVRSSVTEYGKKWLEWASRNGIKLPFTEFRPSKPGTCYAWLYRWRQHVPAISMTLATEGARGVEDRYAVIRRQVEDISPREGWCMDWKVFDVQCWRKASAAGWVPRLMRLWLCSVFDLRSRAVFGFSIADKPNARGITLAYLDAVGDSEWKSEPGLEMLRGIQRSSDPDRKPFALWDNGKDFRSQEVEGREIIIKGFDLDSGLMLVLNTYGVGITRELQTDVRHSKSRNAKAKPIEPWHWYGVGLWEATMPGFMGRKTTEHPHCYAAANRIHHAFEKGKPPKSADLSQLPSNWRKVYERNKKEFGVGTPFLQEEEFKAKFTKRLLEYLRKPHGGLTNARGEMAPIEYLNLFAEAPHKITPISQAILLMQPRAEMVRNGLVTVKWGGEKFDYAAVASDLSDGGALYRLPSKTTVEFRYDENNLGRALVLSGGAPLCWVEQSMLMGYRAAQADFEAAMKKKKEARAVAREFFNTRLDRPDWREEAEARQEPVELRAVVNGPDVGSCQLSVVSDQQEEEPTTDHRPLATVIVPTRFDRRASESGRPALRVVESESEEEWVDDLLAPAPVERSNDDKWKEPWEE